jgi:hypothetical protein
MSVWPATPLEADDPRQEARLGVPHGADRWQARVRCDLLRGLNEPDKGRRGLTAPQVLRALVLMRSKNWGCANASPMG